MSQYEVAYESRFLKDLRCYRDLRKQIRRHVGQVLANPYQGTERLGRKARGPDLRGCRSIRVTLNFRIVFAICAGLTSRGKVSTIMQQRTHETVAV